VIHKMSFPPDVVTWTALLGACRSHNDVERAERVAKHILEMQPQDASVFVVLSNIFGATGRKDDQSKVREMMKDRGVKRTPGQSWIEINGEIHSFVMGDKSHKRSEEIHTKLSEVFAQMKTMGHKPDTSFVLHDVEDEEKEEHLCFHSEKLAIGLGLISTPPGTPLRVVKNLRVCGDCHSATKMISKLCDREIIVRDANRFHHFKDGKCSCHDFF
jgi:DYW family of nucleic acid deaminases